MMKNKSRLPFYRRHARLIWFMFLLGALIGFMLMPFYSHSQTPVKNNNARQLGIYPKKYLLNGDTVAMLNMPQVKKLNLVFNERNKLKYQVGSLMTEIDLLKQVTAEKDTVYVSMGKQLELAAEKTVVREFQIVKMQERFDAQVKEDKRVIRKLRWQKVGLLGVIGVSSLLLIIK